MKFNVFGKTKIILAVVMLVVVVAYLFTMNFGYLRYEETDYETDEMGYPILDEDGNPKEIIKHVNESQLGYIWFPTEQAKVLGGELEAFIGTDYEYDVNDVAMPLVVLFVLGIVVACLIVASFFSKKAVLWSSFAAIWGVVAAYCYIFNPGMIAAGEIPCLAQAGTLVLIQSILAYIGCIIGLAAAVIAYYAKRKNNKLLLESILKRD